ncbi:MAG: hypothetical protein WA125_00750 [Desulfosporosinus sp.]
MAVQNNVVYQTWAMRITMATTLIVVVLSWINAVRIPDIIVRGGISFGVMYLLMAGILSLFERTASQEPQNEQPSSDSGRGEFIDISVGDDELQTPPVQDTRFAGQVNPGLSEGIPDGERQAEIVRRMGWE